jgi:hypothetical protein
MLRSITHLGYPEWGRDRTLSGSVPGELIPALRFGGLAGFP